MLARKSWGWNYYQENYHERERHGLTPHQFCLIKCDQGFLQYSSIGLLSTNVESVKLFNILTAVVKDDISVKSGAF